MCSVNSSVNFTLTSVTLLDLKVARWLASRSVRIVVERILELVDTTIDGDRAHFLHQFDRLSDCGKQGEVLLGQVDAVHLLSRGEIENVWISSVGQQPNRKQGTR